MIHQISFLFKFVIYFSQVTIIKLVSAPKQRYGLPVNIINMFKIN